MGQWGEKVQTPRRQECQVKTRNINAAAWRAWRLGVKSLLLKLTPMSHYPMRNVKLEEIYGKQN